MIKDLGQANKIIENAEEYISKLYRENLSLKRDIYLYPTNAGGHFYPGIEDPCGEGYVSCKCNYCDKKINCDLRGPIGLYDAGECSGNPKAKDAYFELKGLYDRISNKI